jgi:hypothetical protein
MVCFGNALGRHAYCMAECDRHYPNLFAVLVGETAKARKGTSFGRIRSIMAGVDGEWEKQCIHSGLSSGEGVIQIVREPRYQKDKQGKEVLVDEGAKDHRALVVQTEFFQTLTVMTRPGNTLSAVIRDGWDGRTLQTMTKNNPLKASDAHISIIGNITEDELRQQLDHTSIANGFANRFVFVMVRRSKILPRGGKQMPYDLWNLITAVLWDALTSGRKMGEVKMSDAAAAEWDRVYEKLTEGRPGLWGAVTGRGDPQTLRFALIYALADKSKVIDLRHLKAGLAVWDYCCESAKYIFGDLLGHRIADPILLGLRQAGEVGMTREDIYRLFSCNKSSSEISEALRELERHGKVTRQKEYTGGKGRPTERWFAV